MIRLPRRRPKRALKSFLYILTSFTIVIFLTGSIDYAFAGDKPKSADPQISQAELEIPGSFKDLSIGKDPVTEKRSSEEIASTATNSGTSMALEIDAEKVANGDTKKVVTGIDKVNAGSRTLVSPIERAATASAAATILIPNYSESELVEFAATAYCLKGRTASGIDAKPGMIAADPRVLPLGTVVHLRAGSYTGTYTVMDTGGRIRGRRVDVYVPTHREAMQFGRRQVKIKVLKHGAAKKDGSNKNLIASEQ